MMVEHGAQEEFNESIYANVGPIAIMSSNCLNYYMANFALASYVDELRAPRVTFRLIGLLLAIINTINGVCGRSGTRTLFRFEGRLKM